jgi:hypothetical protein
LQSTASLKLPVFRSYAPKKAGGDPGARITPDPNGVL